MKRSRITALFLKALRGITPTDQRYLTPVGGNVRVGTNTEDAEIPCCVLWAGPEVPGPQAGPNGHVVIEYSITALLNRNDSRIASFTDDPDAEYVQIDAVIEDVRQAIEGGCVSGDDIDTIEFLGASPIYHEQGGETCGAIVRYRAYSPRIDYIPGQ